MRCLTYILCALVLCAASDSSEAQILRGRRPLPSSSGSCSGGSCAIPQSAAYPTWPVTQPAPARGQLPLAAALDAAAPVVGVQQLDPIAPQPQAPADPKDDIPNELFGVDWSKIGEGDIDSKGNKISPWAAFNFASGDHTYTKGQCRLVCIGTPAEREPVLKAFNSLPADEKEKLSPWFVAADHWSLKETDSGTLLFETGGKPTVYVLAPDGAVLHRQDGWDAEDDIAAIRKGLKKYDPKRDPDLRKTPDGGGGVSLGMRRTIRKYTPVALVCGGACLVMLLLGRRKV
jgi:hypothetical protein